MVPCSSGSADVPIIASYNYGNDKLGGITESRLESGYWMLPKDERGDGFENTGIYSKTTVTFIPESRLAEIPAFDAFFLDTFQGGQGLSIQLVKMEYRTDTATGTIKVDDLSGMNNLSFKMFDTAVAMAITE